MHKDELAITISLYNRWEELGGLLELLRLNWKSGEDLHVTVITTASEEDLPTWIDRSMIDHIEFGSSYEMPSSSSLPVIDKIFSDRKARELKRIIRSRTVDSIIRGSTEGMKSGARYTMHLHASAWPLEEDKVYQILDAMREGDYLVGCRGLGKKLITDKLPAGDIDDNFFVIDNDFALKSDFWNFDPTLDAVSVSNEGRLARRVYELCSEQQVMFYDDFSDPNDYIFPEEADQRRVQPYNFHKRLGLLRSHDLSKQAIYCKEFGISGPIINKIIEDYLAVPAE